MSELKQVEKFNEICNILKDVIIDDSVKDSFEHIILEQEKIELEIVYMGPYNLIIVMPEDNVHAIEISVDIRMYPFVLPTIYMALSQYYFVTSVVTHFEVLDVENNRVKIIAGVNDMDPIRQKYFEYIRKFKYEEQTTEYEVDEGV